MAEQQLMYRVYTVVDRQNAVPFWLNIGVAFVHRDTKGINILLQALPLDGKLVLRNSEEPPPEGTRAVPSPKAKKKATVLEQA